MVWAGVCYGQRTQVHFIDGILNAQRYRDVFRERYAQRYVFTSTMKQTAGG